LRLRSGDNPGRSIDNTALIFTEPIMVFAPPADEPSVVPSDVQPEALIDLIMARYHAVHRAEFADLIRLAQSVEALHPDHPAVPDGLSALLDRMRSNLEAHMQKEEDGLFPAMRAAYPVSAVAIEIMCDEHDDHAKSATELRRLTRDFTVPPGVSADWRLLCIGTRKLMDDLVEHIRLENDLLFPCFVA
jgi:regulator of cell morphogenesis and NO signaling